jgi:hypothetical protein
MSLEVSPRAGVRSSLQIQYRGPAQGDPGASDGHSEAYCLDTRARPYLVLQSRYCRLGLS